ncbi:hypothetical protein [Dyadobacter frigoris]|uniref:Uncharacterized protein n=1 Tax=Dyadobacter frigoris TaxID=2576211 RepID=A0A4U6CR67_9BACT|nr:hypothetical protein [Dyadobacter frigoris]TKT85961.1 hypothetical protein FDK13_33215 [Dyadobacter frigoris]GLU57170.1 hypothetical protein Dfri01_66310 [Dyadobacter frigoris]
MTKHEAEQWIRQAQKYIGAKKPVVTKSQLGFPSTIEPCRLDSVMLKEDNGDFFPIARLRSVNTGILCGQEDLEQTLEYLHRVGN